MTFEKFPKRCNVCGKKIILTNSQVVFGKLSGKRMYFYCNYCKAWAETKYNEKTECYEAVEMLATKKMRQLQKEILQRLEKDYTENVPEKYQNHLKRLAYELIAKHLQIDIKDCYITTLNINQLNEVKKLLSCFWDTFTYEKNKLIQRSKNVNNQYFGRTDIKKIPLTEEDLLEIKAQARYIMRGKQQLNSSTTGETGKHDG